MYFTIFLKEKNAFLRYKNKMLKNWDFSKGVNPLLLVQKWPVLQLFFFCNIGRENVFYDILEQKDAFLGNKNRSSKSQNIDIF